MSRYDDAVSAMRVGLPARPELRDYVRFGTLASNSHNTQPWKFLLGADTIHILPDFSRRTPIVDPDRLTGDRPRFFPSANGALEKEEDTLWCCTKKRIYVKNYKNKMAISDFEIKRIEKLVGQFVEKRRPDPAIRSQLDLAYRIVDQSFEVYEIRPQWDNPKNKIEQPVAKAT